MKKKNIILGGVITVAILIVLKVGYTCTYVGNIVSTYPWDNYSVSEKIASYVMGHGKAPTKQELYDKGIIDESQMSIKFNKSYYE